MLKTPKRITSIKEIAKLAECSIATVSNTLNNKGRISQEVRDKIPESVKNTATYLTQPGATYAGSAMKRSD